MGKPKSRISSSPQIPQKSDSFSRHSFSRLWIVLIVLLSACLVWQVIEKQQLSKRIDQLSFRPFNLQDDPPLTKVAQANWKTFVITMNTSSPRFRAFVGNNSGLSFEVFLGINGSHVSRAEQIQQGVMTAELSDNKIFTNGMLGATLSHKTLWQRSVQENVPFLIIEDDVIAHPQLADYINYHFEDLQKLHLVSFSANTDTIVRLITPQNLHIMQRFPEDPHPAPERIHSLLSFTSLHRVQLYRLLFGFGTPCYFITPLGAQFFLDHILPLSMEIVVDKVPAYCVSASANRFYPDIQAYLTQPFLAYSPNSDSSTKLKKP